jgi:hypothetical protein
LLWHRLMSSIERGDILWIWLLTVSMFSILSIFSDSCLSWAAFELLLLRVHIARIIVCIRLSVTFRRVIV